MSRIAIALLVSLLAAQPALAQLYRWVDEKGRTHYGANPPPGVKSRSVEGTQGATPPPSAPAAKARPKPPLGGFPAGDPEAEARERAEKQARLERERVDRLDRQPGCQRARESLQFAERNRLQHEAKGRKQPYSNEEQMEALRVRRAEVAKLCY